MGADVQFDDLLEGAVAAARAAGNHALKNRARRTEVAARFTHDVKLQLDGECQQKAEEAIRARFPDHRILGEESAAQPAEGAAPLWVIDPIDGSVNFMHKLPLWCSSVAVMCEDMIVAGAVYLPEQKELYTATLERPAECNGKAIRVAETATLAESLVLTGISKTYESDPLALELLKTLSRKSQKGRLMGAAAVDICRVAAGQADGYVESGIYIWDVAAAGLVVEQAGGRVEALERAPGWKFKYFMATNGRINDEMKQVVQAARSG